MYTAVFLQRAAVGRFTVFSKRIQAICQKILDEPVCIKVATYVLSLKSSSLSCTFFCHDRTSHGRSECSLLGRFDRSRHRITAKFSRAVLSHADGTTQRGRTRATSGSNRSLPHTRDVVHTGQKDPPATLPSANSDAFPPAAGSPSPDAGSFPTERGSQPAECGSRECQAWLFSGGAWLSECQGWVFSGGSWFPECRA